MRFVLGNKCLNTGFGRRRWFVIQQGLGFGDVGAGLRHVTKLEGQSVENGFLARALLGLADQTVKSDGIRFARTSLALVRDTLPDADTKAVNP